MICPSTRLPPFGFSLKSMICISEHSMLMRDSFTRDGFTTSLITGVSVDRWNSSISGGYSPEQTFIASAISSPTTLTTNSRVARMFAMVSFGGLRHTGPNPTTGGSAQNALKKLNGARLSTPAADIVETNAIGRGTTEPISTRYIVCAGIVDGSMIMKSLAGLQGPPHVRGATLSGSPE